MLFPFSLFHESDENGLCRVSYSSNPMERERHPCGPVSIRLLHTDLVAPAHLS